MPRFDRPLWQIIRDYLDEMPASFTVQEMAKRVAQEYPGFDHRSVRRCLRFMSANSLYHMSTVPDDILFKKDRSTYRRYDPDRDGAFDSSDGGDFEDELRTEPTEAALEFALELHLEEFMSTNWRLIDFGQSLNLYEGTEAQSGRQFPTGIGKIDFLCVDASGDFVVIAEEGSQQRQGARPMPALHGLGEGEPRTRGTQRARSHHSARGGREA